MMSEYEKKEVYEYGKQIMLEEERRIGMREGEENKAISMAIAMKKDGADIKLISKYTGLPIEEIRKLWNYNKLLIKEKQCRKFQ